MRVGQLASDVKLETKMLQEENELIGMCTTRTDMDLEDPLMDGDTLFSSQMPELDFDLLGDLSLPTDFLFEDQLLAGDDSNSGGSQASGSDLGYNEASSNSDSSPLSPPSPSISEYSSSIAFQPELRHGQAQRLFSNKSCSNSSGMGQPTSILINTVGVNGTPSLLNVSIPKAQRGRSASHDSPDVQAMKRHIRMIRNRESASISRKKKKDYVLSLEGRIKELETENLQLKQENASLKARLSQGGNNLHGLRLITPRTTLSTNSKSRKSTIQTVAKVGLLSLCCFMFVCFRSPASTNEGPVRISNDTPPSKSMLSPAVFSNNKPHPPNLIRSRRSFGLWAEQERNSTGNGNRKRNFTSEGIKGKGVKEEFFHSERKSPFAASASNQYLNGSTINKCPHHFNQTEALRVQNDLRGIFSVKTDKKKRRKPFVYSLIDLELSLGQDENKGLTVYDEKMRKYSNVLEKLNPREDTFYVVSLAVENQVLLSAKAHNESSRPKMSFLMPWRNHTKDGKEEMMQIDCEVTRVFNLNTKNNRKKRN